MKITRNENNVLIASKIGMNVVFGWLTPEGSVCYATDTAVMNFECNGIKVTESDRRAMSKAIKELNNG